MSQLDQKDPPLPATLLFVVVMGAAFLAGWIATSAKESPWAGDPGPAPGDDPLCACAIPSTVKRRPNHRSTQGCLQAALRQPGLRKQPDARNFAPDPETSYVTPGILQHLFRWGAVALALAVLAYMGPIAQHMHNPGYLAPGMRTW